MGCLLPFEKIVCPSNPNHKVFYVDAVEYQTWVIDEDGDFIEVNSTSDGEAFFDDWLVCAECGADAIIVDITKEND